MGRLWWGRLQGSNFNERTKSNETFDDDIMYVSSTSMRVKGDEKVLSRQAHGYTADKKHVKIQQIQIGITNKNSKYRQQNGWMLHIQSNRF